MSAPHFSLSNELRLRQLHLFFVEKKRVNHGFILFPNNIFIFQFMDYRHLSAIPPLPSSNLIQNTSNSSHLFSLNYFLIVILYFQAAPPIQSDPPLSPQSILRIVIIIVLIIILTLTPEPKIFSVLLPVVQRLILVPEVIGPGVRAWLRLRGVLEPVLELFVPEAGVGQVFFTAFLLHH